MLWKGCQASVLVILVVFSIPLDHSLASQITGAFDQPVIPGGFWYSAEALYHQLYLPDQLFSVVMQFDWTHDLASRGTVKDWSPPYPYFLFPDYWKQFLEPSTALGFLGPLGLNGPLSIHGPLGGGKPGLGRDGQADDDELRQLLLFGNPGSDGDSGGPLSPEGPLGYLGPLTFKQYYFTMYHLNELQNANAFPLNLDLAGVWGVLGPLGPLGPLAALGPLGTLGPYGVGVDGEGNFRGLAGEIIRNCTVQFDRQVPPTQRLYDLYEKYPEARASELGFENDASFMVLGSFATGTEEDSFGFTSAYQQLISVAVCPQGSAAGGVTSIRLAIVSQNSTSEMVSEVGEYVNFLVFRAEAGERYSIKVRPLGEMHQRDYHLFVTGSAFQEWRESSTNRTVVQFNHLNIQGPYQLLFV